MGLEIQFQDGSIGAHVDGPASPSARPRRRPGPGQGELF
jgi:hypothetical protein